MCQKVLKSGEHLCYSPLYAEGSMWPDGLMGGGPGHWAPATAAAATTTTPATSPTTTTTSYIATNCTITADAVI